MDKARKVAMEAKAMADQLEGDLYMAKRALEELNSNGATTTTTTEKGAPAEEDEVDRELATEREMMVEAHQQMFDEGGWEPVDDEVAGVEAQAEVGGTLSGYPDDGTTPENATFEALLKAGTLRLKLVDRPGHAPDQAVEPGPKGRKSDVFEHKDLFKQCNPRFFFNGEAKEWRRTAPEGWTGMPPVVASA